MRPLAFVLVAFTPSIAAAQTQLAWKFKAGDVFSYERIANSDQLTHVKGQQDLNQKVSSKWLYRFEVVKSGADAATIQAAIEQVSVQHLGGAVGVENKHLEKLKGASLTLTVSPRGDITGFDGYEKLVFHVADKNEAQQKAIRQALPEAVVRQEFQEMLTILPRDAVAEGSRWQREGPLATPPLGRFLLSVTGRHGGVDRAGHHLLTGTFDGKYERADQPVGVFRIVAGNLAIENGRWSCEFDNDAGRAINQQSSLDILGEVTVELQGAATPMAVSIRRATKTRLMPRGK